jgi:hypothetical protein
MWALVGGGVPVDLVAIAAAHVGTRTYAALRHRQPHRRSALADAALRRAGWRIDVRTPARFARPHRDQEV